jgi:hypothetical protein
LAVPAQIIEEVATWPIERLTEADIQLAEGYLHRRIDLENGPQLAQQILRRLLARMELPNSSISALQSPHVLAQIVKECRQDE